MTFSSLPPEIAPIAIVIVAIAVRAAVAWQRELTWSEYVAYHGTKRTLFPLIEWAANKWDRIPDLPLISTKGGHEDDEYLGTSQIDTRAVVSELRSVGHELHLVNSLKRREAVYSDAEYEYSVAHTRFVHENGKQTEVYLFDAPDGTDVYVHQEPGVETPVEHLDIGQQVDGDPSGVVPASLF